jgi:HAD superfamily hydrolase (TIGR01484 family)
MIKGIILDVDGVIVGERIGYNSPYPHPDVITRMKSIEEKGIPISLCSGKPHNSIQSIITNANLHNLHITNGGSVVIDPIDNVILKSHIIDKQAAKKVLETYLSHGVYTEIYTVGEYFIQADQQRPLTDTHTHIMQCKPNIADSLLEEIDKLDVVKIMPIAKDEADKQNLISLFLPYKDVLTLSWGVHPVANPHQFGIITAKGISKKQAALKIAQHAHIQLGELLGIGDSTSDWQFIEQCGFAGTLSNGTDELKELVQLKGNQGFIGNKSVDENGVIEIFDYFKL